MEWPAPESAWAWCSLLFRAPSGGADRGRVLEMWSLMFFRLAHVRCLAATGWPGGGLGASDGAGSTHSQPPGHAGSGLGMHQAPCVPGRPILGGQRRGPEDERPLESGPCSDCPVTQSRADGPDQSDPDGALSHAAPQKASGPAEACAPAGKMSDQRSARSATPTATLRPVWPCTLSGWRLMEFFEPPTRILVPTPTPIEASAFAPT